MAITIDASEQTAFSQDRLSGTARANVIDRWIYVFTVAGFIALIFTGFIPDSLAMIAAVRTGLRPPLPAILHIHAILMASFFLLLLGQTILVATGKRSWHMQMGIATTALVPALIIAAIILVTTNYHALWNAALAATAPAKQQFETGLRSSENILLLMLREAAVFPILMWIALKARRSDPGLHKRLMLLAAATILPPAIDRIHWLPTTFPSSAVATDIYTVLAFTPMLTWDLIRNRSLHRAYLIWAALFLPLAAVIFGLWDTPIWHATARRIMGV